MIFFHKRIYKLQQAYGKIHQFQLQAILHFLWNELFEDEIEALEQKIGQIMKTKLSSSP